MHTARLTLDMAYQLARPSDERQACLAGKQAPGAAVAVVLLASAEQMHTAVRGFRRATCGVRVLSAALPEEASNRVACRRALAPTQSVADACGHAAAPVAQAPTAWLQEQQRSQRLDCRCPLRSLHASCWVRQRAALDVRAAARHACSAPVDTNGAAVAAVRLHQ